MKWIWITIAILSINVIVNIMRLTQTIGCSIMISDSVVSKRQADNRKLLNEVSKMIEQYPMLRFGQILSALKITDTDNLFYEEPAETLQRVNSTDL